MLWFATPNGLLRYENGQLHAGRGLPAGLELRRHLLGPRRRTLAVGRQRGTAACAGCAAASRCAASGGPEGLIDDTVYQVLEDDDGRLFLSTPRGLAVVARSAFEAHDGRPLPVLRLGVEDGMLTSECQGTRWPAGWKAAGRPAVVPDRTRRRWPRTRGGIGDEAAPPPVVIERVTIDGVAYDPRRPISAAPGRREIEIVYTSLSFRGCGTHAFPLPPRRLRRGRGWRPARGASRTTRTCARAATASGWPRRARVRAGARAGPRSSCGCAPHFYETRTLVGGCSPSSRSGSLWLGVQWRLRRLRARAEELTLKVNEALASAKVLRGLLPICASCKSIRSDEGLLAADRGLHPRALRGRVQPRPVPGLRRGSSTPTSRRRCWPTRSRRNASEVDCV